MQTNKPPDLKKGYQLVSIRTRITNADGQLIGHCNIPESLPEVISFVDANPEIVRGKTFLRNRSADRHAYGVGAPAPTFKQVTFDWASNFRASEKEEG